MEEKPKRQINRTWDETERNRHGRQVSERFALLREEKIEVAKIIIDELIAQGIVVTQNEIARRTGFSVGFVNKHLRQDIEKANKRQREAARKPRTTRNVETIENEVERLTQVNRRLREELDKQKKINKALLAQVAVVVDLEDRLEYLEKERKELIAYYKASQEKVVHLTLQKADNSTDKTAETVDESNIESLEKKHQEVIVEQTEDLKERINQELFHLGISLNPTLKKMIQAASDETVIEAIEVLKEQLSRQDITNPGGWLNKAIKEKWKKAESLPLDENNLPDEPFPNASNSFELEPNRALASPESLKALNKIFNQPT
jgi:hypothetical protein